MLTCILYIPDSFTDIHNFPITEMICLSRYIKQERVVRKCIYITVVECKLHFMICGSNLWLCYSTRIYTLETRIVLWNYSDRCYVLNLEYGLRTATQRFTRYLTNTIIILSPPFLNSLKKNNWKLQINMRVAVLSSW